MLTGITIHEAAPALADTTVLSCSDEFVHEHDRPVGPEDSANRL